MQTAPSHSAEPAAKPSGDPRRLLALGAALLASALVVAFAGALDGCGSSGASGGGADPATIVPASAPLYAGATVRPSGALKTAALSAGRELTHQADPYVRLVALLQTPGSPTLDYSRDIAPWLGERAGVFTTSASGSGSAEQSLLGLVLPASPKPARAFPFGPGGAQGAIVLDTKDASKAQAFLNTQAAHAGARASTYRGVAIETSAAGVAFAMVRRLAVIGSEAAVRSVIDTSQGGGSLARVSGYSKLAAAAPPGALAHLYSNATAAQAAPGAAQGAGLAQLLAGSREANVSLIPSSASIGLDADIAGASAAGGGGLLAAGVNGSQAFDELPGGSWLALGVGDAGASLSEDVAGLRALLGLATGATGEGQNTPGLSLKGIAEGLLTPLGILGGTSARARSAFSSWMGSGGIFAGGSSLFELRGAVVISSKDPARSRAAVGRLGAALRAAGESVTPVTISGTEAALGVRVSGLPLMLDIADGPDSQGAAKFVLGLGEASVQEALHPQSTLAGAGSTAAAATALGAGIKPNLTANVATIISLLESVGLTNGLSGLLPYLRNVSTVSGGASSLGGGIERVRIVAGLRQSEG